MVGDVGYYSRRIRCMFKLFLIPHIRCTTPALPGVPRRSALPVSKPDLAYDDSEVRRDTVGPRAVGGRPGCWAVGSLQAALLAEPAGTIAEYELSRTLTRCMVDAKASIPVGHSSSCMHANLGGQ